MIIATKTNSIKFNSLPFCKGIIFFFFLIAITFTTHTQAQSVTTNIENAIKKLQADSFLKHASISLYVVNSQTNEVVYDLNSQLGLTPASCEKIITSVTAFELLGKDFRYKTELGYNGAIKNGTLKGNITIKGYGDPTLGSWRYPLTRDTVLLPKWIAEIKKIGIKKIKGSINIDNSAFSMQPVPNGWLWEDIGNYYGAASWAVNWHENQFDLQLKPGEKEGEFASIVSTKPDVSDVEWINEVKTGKSNEADDAYIFLAPYSHKGIITGTIPAGEKNTTLAGANPNPTITISSLLAKSIKDSAIDCKTCGNVLATNEKYGKEPITNFYTHYSPSLDSINYWFLKKSVNLYGEALLKSISYMKIGLGSTQQGIKLVKQFWLDKGIDKSALNIKDGSGLSPQTKITTHSLVTVLQYARYKPWFTSFSNALPIYNGMKLKSGTMSATKGFAGYHTSKAGINYTIVFIINNFEGSSQEMVKKMFLVLDELK